jgi:hypothetical protein
VDPVALKRAQDEIRGWAVGHVPHATGQNLPVLPLEEWIRHQEGYCLQMVLVASMVLERHGIPHRVVNGALVYTTVKYYGGHVWIELADGRVLDPAWGVLEAPGAGPSYIPLGFGFGGGFRFPYSVFPYLELDPR